MSKAQWVLVSFVLLTLTASAVNAATGGDPHLACIRGNCARVSGAAGDQCDAPMMGAPECNHFECKKGNCVKVKIPGEDTCNAPKFGAPECSHLECSTRGSGFACVKVRTPGANTCPKIGLYGCSHKVCGKVGRRTVCKKVRGVGDDECTNTKTCTSPTKHLDCFYTSRNPGRCVWAPGEGPNDPDCSAISQACGPKVSRHLYCSTWDDKCEEAIGVGGPDQDGCRSVGASCTLPSHFECGLTGTCIKADGEGPDTDGCSGEGGTCVRRGHFLCEADSDSGVCVYHGDAAEDDPGCEGGTQLTCNPVTTTWTFPSSTTSSSSTTTWTFPSTPTTTLIATTWTYPITP